MANLNKTACCLFQQPRPVGVFQQRSVSTFPQKASTYAIKYSFDAKDSALLLRKNEKTASEEPTLEFSKKSHIKEKNRIIFAP